MCCRYSLSRRFARLEVCRTTAVARAPQRRFWSTLGAQTTIGSSIFRDLRFYAGSPQRLWEHELEWVDRKASRKGYLFLELRMKGLLLSLQETSIYFIQPFDPPRFQDER